MTTPINNEPAFPLQITSAQTGWTLANHGGLSKREWLAGTIAAGMWANEEFVRAAVREYGHDKIAFHMAACATEAADAQLASLQATNPSSIGSEQQPPLR